MADFPVEYETSPPYPLPMEDRVARLEEDMRDVKSVLSRLEPMIIRIDVTLASTLPHLATRVEAIAMRSEINKDFADLRGDINKDITGLRGDINKDIRDLRVEVNQRFTEVNQRLGDVNMRMSDFPTKTYMWGILGVLTTAYGSGLAAPAIIR
jgi:hypothetical protein